MTRPTPARSPPGQACEVMLTDVAESRRVSRSIRSHLGASAADGGGASATDGGGAPIDATIVSRLCWPHLSQARSPCPSSGPCAEWPRAIAPPYKQQAVDPITTIGGAHHPCQPH
eukprot:scaffold1168_cov123-Isochrysis_galbana.AAC.6